MYIKYYGLKKKPFELTPNPETVFMSDTHKEGLAILTYGILSKKCFLMLTADVGSGKTTLLQALVSSLGEDVHLCLLNNPALYRNEFFSFLAQKFGLHWDGNKASFLIEFAQFLKQCFNKGEKVLLIVDEAHVVPADLLEEIRLLSNLEEKGQDVLSIFLVGQPELNERLDEDRFLPLRQRIGIRFHLARFTPEETKQYIFFRLRAAGARHLNIFSEEAIALVHRKSQGLPRLINIICDHALLSGFSVESPVIGPELIKEAVEDLHIEKEDPPPLPVVRLAQFDRLRFILFYCLIFVLVCAVLLLLEILPMSRNFSPLGLLLPESLLRYLH